MTAKLQKYPRSNSSHVPRPFEIWLTSLLYEKGWRNRNLKEEWFHVLKSLIIEHGCDLVHDPHWHWKESCYVSDWDSKGPHILVGGKGRTCYICTAALHELGHHLLCHQAHDPKDYLQREIAAWRLATGLAIEYQLPFVNKVRKIGLYSYRYRKQLELHPGSKAKTKRGIRTTVDRIAGSKRSSSTGKPNQRRPLGNKGKRCFKRESKRTTSRSERRKAKVDIKLD